MTCDLCGRELPQADEEARYWGSSFRPAFVCACGLCWRKLSEFAPNERDKRAEEMILARERGN